MVKKAKSILSGFIILLIISNLTVGAFALPFNDVTEKDWYRDAVDYCFENGYFLGVSEHRFAPGTQMTRAMFASVIYRMSGDEADDCVLIFDDVDRSGVYAEGIAYCCQKGIINGYGNNKFKPNKSISRQEIMAMLYRYAKSRGIGTDFEKIPLSGYSDASLIRDYAYDAAVFCIANGIVNGTSVSTLSPDSTAKRSEIAQILMNYDENINSVCMDKYHTSSGSPYGIHTKVSGYFNGQFGLNIMGISRDGLTATVTYTVDGTSEYTRRIPLKKGFNRESYISEAMSDPRNLGLTKVFCAHITVHDGNECVFSQDVSYRSIINPDGKRLYYRGQADFDSSILMYHHLTVKKPNADSFSVITTPENFEKNISGLLDMGFTFISLDMLKDFCDGTRALPVKTLALTFDDGYESNYTLAYPILMKYGVPATIFATVENVGGAEKMDWWQMYEMEQSGLVTIQPHSWMHVDHSALTTGQLHEYFSKAIDTVEYNLGARKNRILAYPYGKYSDNSVEIAKSYGFVMQMTVRSAPLDFNRLDLDRLPRIAMCYDTDINRFAHRMTAGRKY